ncbi:MAG: T9SS type A sorting domain-containing protein [Patescibacteria group bacterium]
MNRSKLFSFALALIVAGVLSPLTVRSVELEYATQWGEQGSGDGQFNYPHGVAIASDGNVYVADYNNHRIQVFTADGTFVSKWGEQGSGDGQFNFPHGVAITTNGNVYVVDNSNHRIQEFVIYEPHNLVIADVGNDQGRQIRLSWLAAYKDDPSNQNPVVKYTIWRRIDTLPMMSSPRDQGPRLVYPPGDWDFVMEIPARGEDEYNAVIPTLADSSIAEGMYWSTFFVSGVTDNPFVYYDSAPDSGYSVDNLAPEAPMNPTVNAEERVLAWDPSPETDWNYYTVYGSNSVVFDETAEMLENTTATEYPIGTLYPYYFITATDFNGNESNASDYVQPTGAAGTLRLQFGLSVAPNPFNPMTSITYTVSQTGPVTLTVYDVNGRLVDLLVDNELRQANVYQLNYQPSTSSGIYFVKLTAGSETKTQKIVLLK